MRGILSLQVYELASSHLGHHCCITVEDEHGAISKPVPSSATNCRDRLSLASVFAENSFLSCESQDLDIKA